MLKLALTMAGAMLHPSGTQGLVAIIIPGSAPTDRKGNSSRGVRAAGHRMLAQGLAAEGNTALLSAYFGGLSDERELQSLTDRSVRKPSKREKKHKKSLE